ncbi:MAG: OmpA family protein [Bacteroidia bacterium]
MSKFLSSLLVICLVFPVLHSCNKGLPYELANEYGLKQEAIEALEKEYKSTRDMEKKKLLAAELGKLYHSVNNYTKAEIYYKTAVRDGATNPVTHYEYAQVLKSREKFDDAVVQLEKYSTAAAGNSAIQKEIELCKQVIEWQENPLETRYRVEEEKFLSNGKYHDYAPVIMPEGLVFTSTRTEGEKGESATGGSDDNAVREGARPDLFIAKEQKGKKAKGLQKPVLFEQEGLINTEWSEGMAAFDKKAKQMIYTTCNRAYEKNELSRNDSNCVLMSADRKGRSWSEAQRIPFCTDSTKEIHYGHPCLSEDGNVLYFSSNMPGGFGGYDIWMSTYVKRSKTWSDPINLGATVNSAKDEMYPHIYDNALYMSSNGHPGIGGMDLFVSYGRGTEWSEPKNLLAPMNSAGDDFSIFFERDKKKTRRGGDYGYFASNRGNNLGIDNIYSFTVVPLNFTVSGYVYDKKTEEIIPNAKVTLNNFDDTMKVFVKTNEAGYYFMKLNSETNYSLHPYKERYESLDEDPSVSTYGYDVSMDFERDLYLTPMRPEFELDIQYDLAKWDIRPDAAELLDSFAKILKEHYYTEMELSSHTDSRASDKYNEELAQKRAESAVNYLVSVGIEKERFVAKGYGEYRPKVIKVDDAKDPVTKNKKGAYVPKLTEGNENPVEVTLTESYIDGFASTEEIFEALHQLNRRTEIRILSYDYKPKNAIEEEGSEYIDPDLLIEEEEEGTEEEEGEGE